MMTREQQEELCTTMVAMVVDEVSGMAEYMAKQLEEIDDGHGAMVIRVFKDTMNESFATVMKQRQKAKMQ